MKKGLPTADLKTLGDGSRNESHDKSWLNFVRAAFHRDQMTPDEACLQFPSLLGDRANIWYRQLDRATRKRWPALQKAFELEYYGVSCTAQQKYYDLLRKASEGLFDVLYRMNVQAMEAKVDCTPVDAGRFHVHHFTNTCGDIGLAQ
ncbi:hypothetical protein ATCC90586_011807 [Pythium insidiosum]|nr:hypothetical protein ATCC90586_011807 [Pythium insidiosum]